MFSNNRKAEIDIRRNKKKKLIEKDAKQRDENQKKRMKIKKRDENPEQKVDNVRSYKKWSKNQTHYEQKKRKKLCL